MHCMPTGFTGWYGDTSRTKMRRKMLPPGYRTIFYLYVIEGYDHSEIAALLSISEVASRSQLFKAKALLRKMLLREWYHYLGRALKFFLESDIGSSKLNLAPEFYLT